jgi:hypothetical protein
MVDVSAVSAAVAAGLLSGGGAGYLVSIYTAGKESEDRKAGLQLERDRFEHEKAQLTRESADAEQKYRLAKLDETEALLLLATNVILRVPEVFAEDFFPDESRDRAFDAAEDALGRLTPLLLQLDSLGYEELSRKVMLSLVPLRVALERERVTDKFQEKHNELSNDALRELTRLRMQLTGYSREHAPQKPSEPI